jgi:hypothetical protein
VSAMFTEVACYYTVLYNRARPTARVKKKDLGSGLAC